MHLITLTALRRLISGVDITPGIIRQEFFFFISLQALQFMYISLQPAIYDNSLQLCICHYTFSFQIVFILLHPSISQRTRFRCADPTSTCDCVNLGVVVFPNSIAKCLLCPTHLRPAPSTHSPSRLLCREGRTLGPPGFGQGSANNLSLHPGPSK